MHWAARRRFFIFAILGAVAAAVLAVIILAAVYDAPSCRDATQNQGEEGIDCGGPCATLCNALLEPPTVRYTQALPRSKSQIDIIASVENKNPDAAAKGIPYTVTLYGSDLVLLRELRGTLDLPPGATVPVYVPGVGIGGHTVANAFLTIDETSVVWYRLTAGVPLPTVTASAIGGDTSAPRITATLANGSASALNNVRAVAIVRGAEGRVIAAASTLVPSIPAFGEAEAVFVWTVPFAAVPLSIEVIPSLPLP